MAGDKRRARMVSPSMRPYTFRAGRAWFAATGLILLSSAAPAPPARTVVVTLRDDLKFTPATVTIAPGDTVEWVVAGAVPHTVTDAPGKAGVPEHTLLPRGATAWDSGLLEKGQRYRQVFRVRGAYTYVCLLHEAASMVGRVVVR